MKKSLIIALIVLVVYLLIMLLFFSDFSGNKAIHKKERQTINTYFDKDNDFKETQTITNSDIGIDDILTSLDVLDIGGYDSFKKASYKLTNLSTENKNYFRKYVNSLDDLNSLFIDQKVIFDFDNDKKDEQLLFISNYDNKDAKKWLSAVYYIDSEVNKVILKTTHIYHDSDFLKYKLVNIVDLNNDGNYEIIINKSDNEFDCNDLYELNGDNFTSVFICGLPTI